MFLRGAFDHLVALSIHVDRVQISVELHSQTNKQFDAGLERTARENCRTLKFNSFDFEPEE